MVINVIYYNCRCLQGVKNMKNCMLDSSNLQWIILIVVASLFILNCAGEEKAEDISSILIVAGFILAFLSKDRIC